MENRKVDLSKSQRSLEITIFKTSDEIAYGYLNIITFMKISSAFSELHNLCEIGSLIVLTESHAFSCVMTRPRRLWKS